VVAEAVFGAVFAHHLEPRALDELEQARGTRCRGFGIGTEAAFEGSIFQKIGRIDPR
jgi:hypothetical protein